MKNFSIGEGSKGVEMMERFGKLLLGEDMSGSGNGLCTALAISNAITNLSATVFGELWRLEPLPLQKKALWRREMEWLLCVSNSIVEFIPSVQELSSGRTKESGKACLGDMIYRYISADQFSADCLHQFLDLSSEHQILEIANRIEAAIHVWRSKKDSTSMKGSKSQCGAKVKGLVGDAHKTHFLLDRAETLFHSLKISFPGLSQTFLDMNKIQYNKDVDKSILESYSSFGVVDF